MREYQEKNKAYFCIDLERQKDKKVSSTLILPTVITRCVKLVTPLGEYPQPSVWK